MKSGSESLPHAGQQLYEVATLGGGCFWCTEAVFTELKGVMSVQSGYSGGSVANPSYEEVCTGSTGHAEVVQLTFDPSEITFKDILEIFFAVHDPTTLNRQGADVGTQYRSVIFYRNEDQKRIAEQVISEVNSSGAFKKQVVTQLVPFHTFYKAEGYHQEYYKYNREQPYCQIVIAPKLSKFRSHYAERLANTKQQE